MPKLQNDALPTDSRLDLAVPMPTHQGTPMADQLCVGLLDAAVGLIMLDADGRVGFVNRRAEAMLGTSNLAGLMAQDIVPAITTPSNATMDDVFVSRIVDAGAIRRDIVWTRNATGGWIGVLATDGRGPALDAPAPQHIDAVTGLGNRAHLAEVFGDIVRISDAGRETVMMYLELDYIKRAEEMLDPSEIDMLLKKVAQRLRQVTRSEDGLFRLGESEFAMVVSSRGGRQAAEKLAERVTDLLSRPFLVNGHQVLIGVTIGLAHLSQATPSVDEALRMASIAIRHARLLGQGRCLWFDDAMDAAIRERHAIVVGLRRALLLDELQVFYQPQFSFEGATITGFEALLRWRHPERGMISPVVFIPIAEEMGLINQIGDWVLQQACIAASGWPENLSIAVNVSPLQFQTKDFFATVAEALRKSGLAPHRLELEVTEAVLLKDAEETVRRMDELRALGVRLALDDFGTGYSSLSYLRQFPFTKIKIDQSFVRGPTADAAASRIISSVAGLGHNFGMTVIAEGVETAEQLETMRGCRCDAVQGYLFGKPMPGSEVAAFIANAGAGARPPEPDQEMGA